MNTWSGTRGQSYESHHGQVQGDGQNVHARSSGTVIQKLLFFNFLTSVKVPLTLHPDDEIYFFIWRNQVIAHWPNIEEVAPFLLQGASGIDARFVTQI
jgi:hypothetical protein